MLFQDETSQATQSEKYWLSLQFVVSCFLPDGQFNATQWHLPLKVSMYIPKRKTTDATPTGYAT